MKKNTQKDRSSQDEIREQKSIKREAEKQLQESNNSSIKNKKPKPKSLTNHKSNYKSVDQESAEREEMTTETLKTMKSQLPILLKRLSKIQDYRNPKKIKYKLTVVLIYGILSFIFQMSSRRETNREMTRPMFIKNLMIYFPELKDMPHNDTLMRLLSKIEVNDIESAHIELVRNLIRKKKFQRYLIDNCYPIAMDGTQKFHRDYLWSEECLERTINKEEGDKQYYVYVLEANLVFHNGMSIPLMSEFLNYAEGDTDNDKQDCETRAFHRLARRLKKEFPRLSIMVLLDGLYANGPIMEHCIRNKWKFMIVLKNNCLPTVWEEYEALNGLETKNKIKATWGNRKQHFQWVNEIEYWYGPNSKKKIVIHVVTCDEEWKEVNHFGEVEIKTSRHAWLSSTPLNFSNVHDLCNLAARNRWAIETGILIEKRHGYQYEHCFSYNWNAMKGYHYLMRLGHLFSILAQYSERLIKKVKEFGVRGFIRLVRETIAGPWLNEETVKKRLDMKYQLRLI